jgi:hypothetical protein
MMDLKKFKGCEILYACPHTVEVRFQSPPQLTDCDYRDQLVYGAPAVLHWQGGRIACVAKELV